MSTPRTLAAWLDWQSRLHPTEVELGLERCRSVAQRLGLLPAPFAVISIAGTNGKGSSAALLEAIFQAAGRRSGRFSSPHLLRYNERICIGGAEADDAALCAAFAAIEQARGETSLTYFEFSALAAAYLFRQSGVEVGVLEVGLGGRLDAVNIFDADVALITALDIDHVDWLGSDRTGIALEKAGIMRPGRLAVCGDPAPPAELLDYAAGLPAPLHLAGREFSYSRRPGGWDWRGSQASLTDLPPPALPGDHQYQNAAAVIEAAHGLARRCGFEFPAAAVAEGLRRLRLPGRMQTLDAPIPVLLDVCHNPLGTRILADYLRQQNAPVRTHALVGMLKDKDIAGSLAPLREVVDDWHVAGLPGPRGASAADLRAALHSLGLSQIESHSSVSAAYQTLCNRLDPTRERLLVFGSFLTAAEVLASP